MWMTGNNFFQITTATSIGIVIFLIYMILKNSIKRNKISKHIPGPKFGLFNFIGNLADFNLFYDKSIHHNPNNGLHQLIGKYVKEYRKYGLCCVWYMYEPLVIIMKAKTVEELMSGTRALKKAQAYDFLHPWLGTGLLTSNGKKWKWRRRLLTPGFHFDILKEFLPVFNEQSHRLVEVFKNETAKNYIDIVPPVTLCSLDIICETILGVKIHAQEKRDSEYVKAVLRATSTITERRTKAIYWIDSLFRLTRLGRQFKEDIKLLHGFTRSVIQDRKQNYYKNPSVSRKRKALMDVLMEHHMQTKELTEEDIREEVDTFTFEGHDTTSMGISWALYLIGLHQDVQARLHEEIHRIFGDDTESHITTKDLNDMHYLDCVLKESQRLYPSVPYIGRETTEDIDIGNYKIPKGVTCNVLTYYMHRDEEAFPDPEKFDPDRFILENSVNRHPFAYIPFAAGSRNCIGQRFAQMEVKVVVSTILRHFSLESLDPRDKVVVVPELVLRSAGPLRIKMTPRHFQ